ncbi:MAG TPA: hypothetical protein PK110_14405 [Niabella sp.]|jgi:uncharacterized membrane protein|nr:hypothetical protein [Chitinophagaceae bacterium]HRO86013.1 hypothetical protein [Niabella sp.]HUN03703.1 hypothetical protein [Niabella sp.]
MDKNKNTFMGMTRGEMSFLFAILLGLIIGSLIKKVRLGIILGLLLGLFIIFTNNLRIKK